MKRVTFSVMLLLILQSSACLAQAKGEPKIGSREELRVEIAEAEAKVLDFASRLRAQAGGAATALRNPRLTKAILLNETRQLFDLQSKLQVMELDAAEAKIDTSRLLLEKRRQNVNAIVSERVDRLLNIPPQHASPEAAVAALERFASEKDWKGYVSMLTDDEVRRMAGVTLRFIYQVRIIQNLPGAGKFDATSKMLDPLNELMERSLRAKPSVDAASAFSRLIAGDAQKTALNPKLSAKEFSELLKVASGVLTAPRPFMVAVMDSVDSMMAMEAIRNLRLGNAIVAAEKSAAMGATKANYIRSAAGGKINSIWTFIDDGERGTAIQQAKPIDRTYLYSRAVEFRQLGNMWKIASLISDERMMNALVGTSWSEPQYTKPAPEVSRPNPASISATQGQKSGDNAKGPANFIGRWRLERSNHAGLDQEIQPLEIGYDGEIMRLIGQESSRPYILRWRNQRPSNVSQRVYEVDFVLDPNGAPVVLQGILQVNQSTLEFCMELASSAETSFRPEWFVPGEKVWLVQCSRIVSDVEPKVLDAPWTEEQAVPQK